MTIVRSIVYAKLKGQNNKIRFGNCDRPIQTILCYYVTNRFTAFAQNAPKIIHLRTFNSAFHISPGQVK